MIYINSTITEYLHSLLDISFKSIFLIFFTCLGIYIAVVFFTRIYGKRSFSKISSFDFAMTVAIGSIIATCILSDTVNLAYGIFALFTVYSLQLAAAFLRRYDWFQKLIDNQPTLIMDGETILKENMKAVRVTEKDLRSKLRESNVTKLSQIKAVIFETTGNIVVLHNDNTDCVDDWILQDVKK